MNFITPHHTMKKHLLPSALIILTILSLLFYFQQPGFFQHDMVEYAQYAEYIVHNQYDYIYQPYFTNIDNGAFPWRTGTIYLGTITYYILYKLTGTLSAEFAIFLTQFIFGTAAIVFLYLFLYELFKRKWPAFFASLTIGLSAPLFNSFLSKEQGTEFFFAFAAMYFLLVGLKKRNTFLLFFSNISLGVMLWMRESALLFPIIYYGFLLLYCTENKENIKQHINIKNIAALTIPYFILAIIAVKMYVWLLITNAANSLTTTLFSATEQIAASIWTWYPLLFFAFILCGLFYGYKNKNKTIFLFTTIIIFFLTIFTKNATFDIRHLGTYVFFPCAVIITYAIAKMTEKNENKTKSIVVYIICALFCIQLFTPGITLFEERKQHIYTEEFAESIQDIVPEDATIFMQHDFCRFVAYYAKRTCKDMPTNVETIDTELTSRHVFIPFHLGFGRYDDTTKEAIENTYTLTPVYTGKFETFHHADLNRQVYEESLIEVNYIKK
jgi:hypothetical protein